MCFHSHTHIRSYARTIAAHRFVTMHSTTSVKWQWKIQFSFALMNNSYTHRAIRTHSHTISFTPLPSARCSVFAINTVGGRNHFIAAIILSPFPIYSTQPTFSFNETEHKHAETVRIIITSANLCMRECVCVACERKCRQTNRTDTVNKVWAMLHSTAQTPILRSPKVCVCVSVCNDTGWRQQRWRWCILQWQRITHHVATTDSTDRFICSFCYVQRSLQFSITRDVNHSGRAIVLWIHFLFFFVLYRVSETDLCEFYREHILCPDFLWVRIV